MENFYTEGQYKIGYSTGELAFTIGNYDDYEDLIKHGDRFIGFSIEFTMGYIDGFEKARDTFENAKK